MLLLTSSTREGHGRVGRCPYFTDEEMVKEKIRSGRKLVVGVEPEMDSTHPSWSSAASAPMAGLLDRSWPCQELSGWLGLTAGVLLP